LRISRDLSTYFVYIILLRSCDDGFTVVSTFQGVRITTVPVVVTLVLGLKYVCSVPVVSTILFMDSRLYSHVGFQGETLMMIYSSYYFVLPYNVLGKRAGQASEPVKISPTLPSTINYRSNIGDIETKQLVLQTTELNSMSNFTTLATL
jgi:hypothetical protein